MLDCIEWDALLTEDVNQYWSTWKHYFLQILELCIPHTVANVKRNPPWITKNVLNAIKKRDKLFRTAKSTGNPADCVKYNRKRNEVVSMLRECKQSFFNLQLNNADTKTFWKTVCSLKQMSSSTIPTLHDGDKTARTSLDTATTLNNFFLYLLSPHSTSTL